MTYNKYYNSYGQRIKNVSAYASTGAPMYKNFTNKYGEKIYNPTAYVNAGGSLYSNKNINEKKTIYVIKRCTLEKLVFYKRANQHFNGTGSELHKIQKNPDSSFSEQEYTDI